MNHKIFPGFAAGKVRVPASKSVCHRALIAAALAEGTSVLHNISFSQDIEATIDCLRLMGADCKIEGDTVAVSGGALTQPKEPLFCRESGSTLRFLIPLAAMFEKPVSFTGKGRLMERPQTVYQELFSEKGLSLLATPEQIVVNGPLKGGRYRVRGDVSSQFITGLLLVLPLLKEDSVLEIIPPFESRDYVVITLSVLHDFGVHVDHIDPLCLRIPGRQTYKARSYTVEGDYSQSAFFEALGALNGEITCTGLNRDSLQGDRIMNVFLRRMGAELEESQNELTVRKSPLRGQTFSIEDCPDLGPILMVCAAFAQGASTIVGTRRLQIKESDRGQVMAQELRKLGAEVLVEENRITVVPTAPYAGGIVFDGHNDHRIVMSMAVAAASCKKPSVIRGIEAVSKSYPSFFEDLEKAGLHIEVCGEEETDDEFQL